MGLLDQLLSQNALAGMMPGEFPIDPDKPRGFSALRPSDNPVLSLLGPKRERPVRPMEDGSEIPGLGSMEGVGLLNKNQFAGLEDFNDQPPATNDPASGEPQLFQNGVPVPKPRPIIPSETGGPTDLSSVSKMQSENAAGTPAAAPAVTPQTMPAAAPDAGEFPKPRSGMFGSLFGGVLRPENAPLFMSLAGGFAGAPSIGTGMRRAFSGATPAAMQLQTLQKQEVSQASTYRALIAKGVPPQEAMAAVLDPNVMKAVAGKYFETKPPTIHDITDALGNKTPVVFDPSANQGKGAFRDMAGKPIGDAASVSGGGTQVLAPGVKYNSALPAEDYFDQFSDDMKAAMKSYLKGETQPSNPRMQNIWNIAKMYAKTYADKAGLDASDQTYQERLTHQREMASGKAGVGMQRTALRQGLEHLEGATKQAIELGNYGLGLAPLSEGVNAIRGLTDSQKGKVTAFDNKIQTLAGEIGKFFSSAQGGGVHERELTRNRFKGITAPNVLADAIDSTLELMEGGLHSREQAQQQLFSGDVPKKVQYMTPDDHARIERIRALSQQLRSGAAAGATPAAAPGGTAGPRKIQWSIER